MKWVFQKDRILVKEMWLEKLKASGEALYREGVPNQRINLTRPSARLH